MADRDKTKEQLLLELNELQQKYQKLKKSNEISNHQQELEFLNNNAERLEGVLKNSPVVLFHQDLELRYTWIFNANPGFDAKTVIGKTDADLLPENDAVHLIKIKKGVLETGLIAREIVRTTINEKAFFYELIVEPLRDSNNNITGISCVSIDITERILAQQVVKENEEKLNTVFSVMEEGMAVNEFVYDDHGEIIDYKILEINQSFEKITALKREQVVGRNATQVYGISADYIKSFWKLHINEEHAVKTEYFDEIHKQWISITTSIPVQNIFLTVFFDITERKLAEEALEKSRTELHEYFENDISADYVVSVEGEILSCNNTFLKFFGFEKKSLLENFNMTDLYKNPDDSKKLLQKVKETGKVENYEVDFVTTDGQIMNTILNAIGIFNNEEELIQIRGYIVDITQLKTAEETLLKLSHAVEQSPVSILITDTKGNIEYINPKVSEITGYSLSEIIGKNPRIFSSGEKSKSEYKELWQSISSGKEWFGEFHNKKKNDELYWEFASISPIINDKSEITHYVAVKEDITEQKRFENTRKLLLEILQSNSKHISLYSFLGEVHQKIRQVIRADNFYVGLYNEIDKTYSFPYHIDEYDEVELNKPYDFSNGFTDYVLKSNQSLIITPEYQLEIEKDGITTGYGDDLSVWLGVPLKSAEDNKPKGVIAIQDYKNLKTYTEADKSIMEIIAQSISSFIERINYLEELVQAKEKAEESDRLKSAFLSNMSHEIRTPMNGILGFIELLKNPDLSGNQQKEYMEIVNKSGNRLLNTINDIIEISKIEAGQSMIYLAEIDLYETMNSLLLFFKPEAEKSGISLRLNNERKNKLLIKTDSNKLESILINLIKNAIKFTKKGFIEFGFSIHENEIHFFVKDTGVGIRADRLKGVFNRFEQAELGISRGYEGSGLGLSIAKSYTEMLGGKIGVDSEINKGSNFYFSIKYKPVSISNQTEDTGILSVENKKEFIQKTILVAEDDEASYEFIEILLTKEKHKVIWATNGEKAVAICKNNPEIDLILMDLKMPKMDGTEATRQIRKFNRKIIIIAQTAYALEGDREIAIAAGCNNYISKPIKANELFLLLKKYF